MITENLGSFYVGAELDTKAPVYLKSKDFTTHAVILGMTGSGKTGLGIDLLEDAAIDGIPALIIDPKGDLADLKLAFPEMRPEDFAPWLDDKSQAEKVAKEWKAGIEASGQSLERVKRFKNAAQVEIYTPGSLAGKPLSLLNRLDPPEGESFERDDQIATEVSALLGLLGVQADPLQSPAHILLSKILATSWDKQETVDLPSLIQQIRRPSFAKVGIMDLESFMPEKDRVKLALQFNNLIASPGFERWIQGEPLDIQRLLWTEEGKPKLSVLSIAHLNDAERMFFVTLLLNRLIGWMRQQSGTEALRALLYMDEIFGYFPPDGKPPSKLPMLTLLKQARAYGLGIILSTQNPVDLDYKGLANTGTWMIGHLQTENDKKRLMEGLPDLGKKALDETFMKREFLLKSPDAKEIIRFQTRWSLSYLKGPLTLSEIKSFYPKADEIIKQAAVEKFHPPASLEELYLRGTPQKPLEAHLLAISKVHWVDKTSGVDTWKDLVFLAPVKECALWDDAEIVSQDDYTAQAPEKASYAEVVDAAFQDKALKEEKMRFANWVYRSQNLDLFQAPDFKLKSLAGESEGDFRARVQQKAREVRDEKIQKLDKDFQDAYRKLQEKIAQQEVKVAKEQDQAGRQRFDTYVSLGSTLLGALFGHKSSAIERAGTTMRRARRIGTEEEQVEHAKTQKASAEQDLDDLVEQHKKQAEALQDMYAPENLRIDKTSISPRKSDITLDRFYLVWQ